ncbi:unnamed protein product [Linum tenue]|uniref:Uncharacterized protein n=1 Tax=Linum tenue TaxID=586396 RepID=A0AAV0QYI3_9ROSI|nr:unnamed protein product [Linum tenue]
MAFSIVPLQTNTIDYHTDITACVRRISVPTTVRGTLREFNLVIQDVSGSKASVLYRGYDIPKFLENAPTAEAHLPLIVTIKAAIRVPHLSTQKYKYRFESTPATFFIVAGRSTTWTPTPVRKQAAFDQQLRIKHLLTSKLCLHLIRAATRCFTVPSSTYHR